MVILLLKSLKPLKWVVHDPCFRSSHSCWIHLVHYDCHFFPCKKKDSDYLANTVWKFKGFSAIQSLREIKFGSFRVSKTDILAYLAAQNLDIFGIFNIFKCAIFSKIKIGPLKWPKLQFLASEIVKFDFTYGMSGSRILEFPHYSKFITVEVWKLRIVVQKCANVNNQLTFFLLLQ